MSASSNRRSELTTIQFTKSERDALKRLKRGGESYADLLRRKKVLR